MSKTYRTLLLGAILHNNLHDNNPSCDDFDEVVTNAIQYPTNLDDIKKGTTYPEKLRDVYL